MPRVGPITRHLPPVRLGRRVRAWRGGLRRGGALGLAAAAAGSLAGGLCLTAAAGATAGGHPAPLAGGRPPITVSVHPRVVPDRAGTPARPQPVHLDVRMTFGIPPAYDPPLVSRIEVWFPRGGRFDGGRYPRCSRGVLVADGPTHCPPGSIMGHGTGRAMAARTPTRPAITIVGDGARRVWFYTVLTNPARVQEPVPGVIRPLHGRWSYELIVTIPRNLQIVAGTPVVLHSLSLSAGRDDWMSTTGCPADRRWPWRAVGLFTDGQRIATHGAVPCRPASGG